MNIIPRLIKSNVEYLDYIWGFYRGCKYRLNGACTKREGCETKKITKRSEHSYPDGFEPAFYPESPPSPLHLRRPSRIGVSFMGDLFEDCVNPESPIRVSLRDSSSIRDAIFKVIALCPQHIFIFLTRCPWNLQRWSPFPENCWVGVAASDYTEARWSARELRKIEAGVKFLSFEPLLAPAAVLPSTLVVSRIGWVTVGAHTDPCRAPDIKWVEEIVDVCDMANVPVFLKSNLERAFFEQNGIESFRELFRGSKLGAYKLRQQLPQSWNNLLPEV